ncbi:MAG: alpha/beta hydrolase [Paludibacteraceae bacterium]|nr:alpha/beta hydrolase [Paludibacteraceae bacterium]
MKKLIILALATLSLAACNKKNEQTMQLTQEWDKVFPLSGQVNHRKVTFENQYGITLAADLYAPEVNDNSQMSNHKYAAIAVSGPFGATKEQSSGLYAMKMAERGFIALAFDPSFTGESGPFYDTNGSSPAEALRPHRTASPDINTEDFMAAVDFLSKQPEVDANRIGIIGICGWGGIALNAAAADTRIKATVAATMYDMTRVAGNGYFDSADNEESRHAAREALAEQRLADPAAMAGGVIDPLPDDAPQFVKDYYDYYKTARGYHPRSGNSTDGWRVIGTQAYANSRFLYYINEIRSAVLIVHGEKAHSRYFGEAAYHYMLEGKAEGYKAVVAPNPVPGNKELLIIPGATHCDLYDGGFTGPAGHGGPKNLIPWDKLARFFNSNL